jgi:nucleoside-diphosphate-sugar epimerase
MIYFNGITGGLGQYMPTTLTNIGIDFTVLRSRLSDSDGLTNELDASMVSRKIATPPTLIQIAGLVPVPYCEEHPQEAFQTNVTDTLATVSTFIQWAERHGNRSRVLYVSTGHVYDKTVSGKKLTEDNPVNPRSVYAKTKREAEKAISSLANKLHTDYLIARVFGLLSPNQSPNYVLPSLIRRVRESNFSEIPGLSYVRDYLDARDVCAHLAQLSALEWNLSKTALINICSGEPLSIRELLMKIVDVLGMNATSLQGLLTEATGRLDDVSWMVGDPQRLIAMLGRPPRTISLDQTIQDALKRNACASKSSHSLK